MRERVRSQPAETSLRKEARNPGPDDPFAGLNDYEVHHLVPHLAGIGRDRDVHRLLRLSAGPGRGNAWYAEKLRRESIGEFLADVNTAWDLSARACRAAFDNAAACPAFADEVRYALLTTSVNSLSRQFPPALLAALVRVGELPVHRALTYATQQPFAPLRAEAFALLSDHCAEQNRLDCLQSGWDATRSIRSRPDWKVRALGQLAAHAPEALAEDLVREGLEVLREIGLVEADENAAALFAAAPPSLRDAVDAVLVDLPVTTQKPLRPGIEDLAGRPSPWTFGVTRFAQLLPGCGEQARDAALTALRGSTERAHAALALAACSATDPHLADEAMTMLDAIREPDVRLEVLAALAVHLPIDDQVPLLGQAAAQAAGLPALHQQARALTAVAAALPEGGRSAVAAEALAAIRGVEDASLKSYLLRFLAAVAPEDLLGELVDETASLPPRERGRATAALAARAPRALVRALARLGQRIDDRYDVVRATVVLARTAPAAAVAGPLDDLLSFVMDMPAGERARFVAELEPVLQPRLFARVAEQARAAEPADAAGLWRAIATRVADDGQLAQVRCGGDGEALLEALRVLAEHAEPERRVALLREAWDVAGRLDDVGRRVAESLTLWKADLPGAPAAPEGAATALLAAISRAGLGEATRVDLTAPLVAFLPDDVRAEVVADLLATMRTVMDEQRPWIDELAPHLRPLEWIPAEYLPGSALESLLPWLAPEQHRPVMQIVERIRDEVWRESALHHVARTVPGDALVTAGYFEVAGTLTRAREWIAAHLGALPRLDDTHRAGLAAWLTERCRTIPPEQLTVGLEPLWSGLAPYWDADDLDAALDTASRIPDPWVRGCLTAPVVRHLPTARAIEVATMIEATAWRARALVEIAGRSDADSCRDALLAAVELLGADEELLPIASHLPDGQRVAVLKAVARQLFSGVYVSDRGEVLEHLATLPLPHLYALWRDSLAGLTGQTREKVLDRVVDLVQTLRRMWGEQATPAVMAAILDVSRWWP